MSKSKGSSYEREFVHRVQDMGLPAHRVPLSGSMAGFPDDVVVADTWRIECKYRRTGTGFKKLYDWIAGHDHLTVETPDGLVHVSTLQTWCRRRIDDIDSSESLSVRQTQKKSRSTFATLREWIGDADYLAVRMPRSPWLVIRVTTNLIEAQSSGADRKRPSAASP